MSGHRHQKGHTPKGVCLFCTVGQETVGEKIPNFFYDSSGQAIGFKYRSSQNSNGSYYYYMYNSRGDILGFYNSSGDVYATYTYDAWGLVTSVKNSSGQNVISPDLLANIQPLRYRGYVYDNETGLYYLQSRYYDPVTRRFINADGLVSTGSGVLGYNMFAYCENCPVMLSDYTGSQIIYTDLTLREAQIALVNRDCAWSVFDISYAQKMGMKETDTFFYYRKDWFDKVIDTIGTIVSNIEMDADFGFGFGVKGGIEGIAGLELSATDTLNLHIDGNNGSKFNFVDAFKGDANVGLWDFSLIDTSDSYNINFELENSYDNLHNTEYLKEIGFEFGGYFGIGGSISFSWNLKRIWKQIEAIWR